MVSLWPWKVCIFKALCCSTTNNYAKSEDNSPASFEKTLSSLATKISKSQLQLDSLRQRGRRVKALWTLYTSFTYLLCFIILVLVVGWRNWSAWEYTAVSGGPLLYGLLPRVRIVHLVTALQDPRYSNWSHSLLQFQSRECLTSIGGAPSRKGEND